MAALWSANWTAITCLCSLKARPTHLGAWPIDAGRVAVYTAHPIPLLGHCQDGKRLNVEHSGYRLISVMEGCEVVIGDLLLRGGHQDSSKTVVTIRQDVEAWQELLPDTNATNINICLLYTSPSPRDKRQSRMPSSA